MAVSNELHKFFSALKACENYAKSLQRLDNAIDEINSRLGDVDEAAKALVLLFDGNIPAGVLEKINSKENSPSQFLKKCPRCILIGKQRHKFSHGHRSHINPMPVVGLYHTSVH